MPPPSNYLNIDPARLAQQYTQFDRARVDARLQSQQAEYTSQLRALSGLENRLDAFVDSMDALSEPSDVLATSISTSNSSVMQVSSDGAAATGSYAITVQQVAQAHQLAMTFAQGAALPSDGELSVTLDGNVLTLDMASLESDATLQDVAQAINSHVDNPGVSATLVRSSGETHLVVTSDDTGASNTINLDFTVASDPAGNAFDTAVSAASELSAAQDALLYLGSNNAITITSSSNTIDNAIEGVTLDLLQAQEAGATPLRVDVVQDSAQMRANVDTFVRAYNDLAQGITNTPALQRDSTARSIISRVRQSFQQEVNGQTLYSIGLEFDRNGRLSVDSTRLNDALSDDPEQLSNLLSGENGLVNNIVERLEPYSDRFGVLHERQQNIQDGLQRLATQQERHNYSMEQVYQRYLNNFTNMQSTIAQLESSMGQFS